VREVVRRNLPAGYQETMNWGMISYEVPLSRYPETYNGQPLCYAAIAAQKSHYSLYLMAVSQDGELTARLRRDFQSAGKKLDMGKSCVRFKQLDDLPLDAVGRLVGAVPVDDFIARYETSRKR
jgi:uncharacterized protein DUF1801